MRRNRRRFDKDAAENPAQSGGTTLTHNSLRSVAPLPVCSAQRRSMVRGSHVEAIGPPSECSKKLAAALEELRRRQDIEW